jgi:signal transduction histidine kinase
LLDVLLGLSLLLAIISATDAARSAVAPGWLLVLYVVMVLVCLASWFALRRVDREPLRTVATAGFVLAGAALWFLGSTSNVPIMLLALLVLIPRFGLRAGIGLAIIMIIVAVPASLAFGRNDPMDLAINLLGVCALLAFGLLLAVVMAELRRQRQQIAALLGLTRQGFAAEKDLALADERARAARELHDGLGHDLTLIGMSLDFALRTRDQDRHSAWQEVESARVQVGSSLQDMRRWVRALHPVRAAPGSGAVAALSAIADGFKGTDLDVTIVANGQDRQLQHDALLFVHRFAQEGLTNVLRHCGPADVVISYGCDAGRITLTITDDGGPRPDSDSIKDGFGLRSLKERADALGGRVDASRHESGFVLRADFPAGEER